MQQFVLLSLQQYISFRSHLNQNLIKKIEFVFSISNNKDAIKEFLFEERNTNLYNVIFKFYAAVIKIQHRQTWCKRAVILLYILEYIKRQSQARTWIREVEFQLPGDRFWNQILLIPVFKSFFNLFKRKPFKKESLVKI